MARARHGGGDGGDEVSARPPPGGKSQLRRFDGGARRQGTPGGGFWCGPWRTSRIVRSFREAGRKSGALWSRPNPSASERSLGLALQPANTDAAAKAGVPPRTAPPNAEGGGRRTATSRRFTACGHGNRVVWTPPSGPPVASGRLVSEWNLAVPGKAPERAWGTMKTAAPAGQGRSIRSPRRDQPTLESGFGNLRMKSPSGKRGGHKTKSGGRKQPPCPRLAPRSYDCCQDPGLPSRQAKPGESGKNANR
jgi:hypothetical protein